MPAQPERGLQLRLRLRHGASLRVERVKHGMGLGPIGVEAHGRHESCAALKPFMLVRGELSPPPASKTNARTRTPGTESVNKAAACGQRCAIGTPSRRAVAFGQRSSRPYCNARDPTASNVKRRFQSSFMLMTVQPLLFASS